MLNILSIDLEDYFMVSAFEGVVKRENWDKYESRIERNTHRLLDILNGSLRTPNSDSVSSPCASIRNPQSAIRNPVKATFFCLGWIAERYPNLIKEIHRQGHEISCHSYDHQLVYNMSPDQFREDITKSKKLLEDISGEEVTGYRAPSYSITKKSLWAFDILAEEGYRYDSSIFPIHHDRYGIPNAPRLPFLISMNGNNNFEFSTLNFESRITPNSELRTPNSPTPASASVIGNDGNSKFEIRNSKFIMEFPISTVRVLGQNLPISGGGYFRLLPYAFCKKGLRRINEDEGRPFIFYIHPWELDPDQPRINSISRKSRFRHYRNLKKTEIKFKNLLKDFNFAPIVKFIDLNDSRNPKGDCT